MFMRVLLLGQLDSNITAAGRIAIERGAKVAHVETLEEGLNYLRGGKGADIILADLKVDIKRLVKSLETERINTPIVVCGIDPDPELPARAIRDGAKEYLPLPPNAEMIAAILNAISSVQFMMIFKDPKMQTCVKMAERVAPTEASVLLTGQSGTGKEVMARFIHMNSRRADKAFISINCAAIPEHLLESELFGHEKGAFTGAIARRIGKFEEASGGTLLLDEISEMSPHLQAKLLRAIQEREIDRVGGTAPVKIDIRLIATSNRDLQEAVAKKEFREDLYFRLNVINIQLPALAERPQDIEHLAKHFIKKYSKINNVAEKDLSSEALQAIRFYPWPGNVRELENTVHRAVVLSAGAQISVDDLFPMGMDLQQSPSKMVTHSTATPQTAATSRTSEVGQSIADMEKTLILDTLKHCLGNRTHAATILGISIRTLRNKLQQYAQEGMVPDENQHTWIG